MNGVHDMGGMHGFGPVDPEPGQPVFHAEWEGRVFALRRALGYLGAWNLDELRFVAEALPPEVYLGTSYWQRWELVMERLLLDHGLVDAEELAAGHAARPAKPVKRTLAASDVSERMTRGSVARPSTMPARFKVGARVRARNINSVTHTRLPRYARGHVGLIEAVRGCHVFPDTQAIGKGENPQWLYAVVFEGRELWGEGSDPALKVSIEAFEPYLEPA